MNDFLERMKTLADKGIEASKGVLGQAGETVKDLSDKGVTKVELLQLEKKAQKKLCELGESVYDLLSLQEKKALSLKDANIEILIEDIKTLKAEIEIRKER